MRRCVPGPLPNLGLFVVGLTVRLLIGPALRDGALHSLHRPTPTAPRSLPLLYGALLLGVIALGLPRDPLALDAPLRLHPPS